MGPRRDRGARSSSFRARRTAGSQSGLRARRPLAGADARHGEIDALVTARTAATFRRSGGAVRRLFEKPWEVERDYFRRTGIFPIMHTLVVKKEILEANPWVAFTLFKAFSEAKDLAMADLTQTSALPLSLPFLVEHAYQTMDLMGEDFWPYGLESNRKTLETFVRYMHEQGLIPEPMSVETLFPASTQRTFRV
jgi:4,5-dihydroxyphthalate decarboxylase